MNYENNENENQFEIEKDAHQNPAQFFKVTPDDYTDSDSNTIIDFDEEEDSKTQNQMEDQNQNQEEIPNQDSDNHENHEDFNSQNGHENEENEEQKSKEQNQEEEHENKNQEQEHSEIEGGENAEEGEEKNNGEGHEEEQDNHEENEEEDEGITDPNVKQLMKIDLNDKDGIIDLLMKDNLVKKTDVKTEKIIKEKNKVKFEHVESTINKNLIGNKKNTYGRQGFQIVSEEGDPEFIKDMNIAAYVVKEQLEEENEDVAKILFDDNDEKKISKRITREQIDEKVKKILEKKKKNLEKIEAQMYEQQKYEETFTPVIYHRKGENKERRNLNAFLNDQNNFSKKVQKKREDLLNAREQKNHKENYGKPKVDKNSEELAKKLNNTVEPAYLRLYKKRTLENEKRAEKEKIRKEKKKEEAKKSKKEFYENQKLYGHIQSRIDMGQKKDDVGHVQPGAQENKNNKETKEKEIEKKKEKEKIIEKRINKKKAKLLDIKDIQTNKILLNNFEKRFQEACQSFSSEKLSELDLNNLLDNIGMMTIQAKNEENNGKEENENENDKDNNEEKVLEKNENNKENPLQQEEKKLMNEIFNCLKDNQNEINKEDLKNFLICIIGIQKYYFYQRFKTQHKSELQNLFPVNKFKKEDLPELMIRKQNEEIISKVDKNNEKNCKYAYKTNDGAIYISLEKGHAIKKDFSILALNYRNYKKDSKENDKLLKDRKEFNFRPTINENSEKLYQKYKDKVISIKNDETESNQPIKDSHMQYIERILLHDKKRIAETQKTKEELEKQELKECTFKPKINQDYIIKNKQTRNNDNEKKNRMEELYEKGTADIKKRKNRTKEEIEIEKHKNECTFRPNFFGEINISETKFSNDIYKEKEYKHLYERLKKGRMERKVKNSAIDRYGLDNELKKFVTQSKENNNKEFIEEEKIQDIYEENNTNYNNNKNNKIEKKESGNKSSSPNKNEEVNFNNSLEQSSEEDGEKKEGIPLLIIDVNIRQGVKKKIYVYEGDTPEGLAEKFAKEHNLEEETKNKLQNLIHSHMLRLLTRIEEENLSISEKSQTTHNNKK